jgi:hypothetical protein
MSPGRFYTPAFATSKLPGYGETGSAFARSNVEGFGEASPRASARA